MTSTTGRPKAAGTPPPEPRIGDRYREIRGWGADLDPANRPGVPRARPSDITTPRGRVPERQVPRTKIYVSIEHPDITPVFGTAVPPRLVSGLIRDAAFRFSEGRIAHWMLLLLADRVNIVEGELEDLARGRIREFVRDQGERATPRFLKERSTAQRWLLAGAALGLTLALAGGGDD